MINPGDIIQLKNGRHAMMTPNSLNLNSHKGKRYTSATDLQAVPIEPMLFIANHEWCSDSPTYSISAGVITSLTVCKVLWNEQVWIALTPPGSFEKITKLKEVYNPFIER